MNNNNLPAIQTEKLVGQFTKEELATLKQTIAKGATDEQFSLFIQTCYNSQMNPFLGQIYCIVYQPRDGSAPVMSIQTAAEGYLAQAKKFEDFEGITSAVVHENDEFEADFETGKFIHKVKFPRGQIVGAYCQARRKGFIPYLALVDKPQADAIMSGGRNQDNWRKYYSDFIVKTAEKRALRKQFGLEIPDEDGGAFVSGPVGDVVSQIDDYRGKNPNAPMIPLEGTSIEYSRDPNAKVIETDEGETQSAEGILTDLRVEMNDKMTALGMNGDDLKELAKLKYNSTPGKLNPQQLTGFIKMLSPWWNELQKQRKDKPQESKQTSIDDLAGGMDV